MARAESGGMVTIQQHPESEFMLVRVLTSNAVTASKYLGSMCKLAAFLNSVFTKNLESRISDRPETADDAPVLFTTFLNMTLYS